jgi:hypothetical protein
MEPTRDRVRPIHVRTRLKAAAVVIGCLVTLAGCGSAPAPSAKSFGSPASSPTASPTASPAASPAGDCASDSVAFAQAELAGSVDLDGDGSADAVRVTTGSTECPARLIAKVGDTYAGGELPGADPAPAKAFGVRIGGQAGDLLVTRQDHPRGGYQLHVFAKGPDGLVELTDAGKPLVPFVATDTRPIPYTVDCHGDAIVVSEAVAKPSGTWDLSRTTYTVAGSTATKSGQAVAAAGLSPKRIDQLMPVGKAVFPSCRS